MDKFKEFLMNTYRFADVEVTLRLNAAPQTTLYLNDNQILKMSHIGKATWNMACTKSEMVATARTPGCGYKTTIAYRAPDVIVVSGSTNVVMVLAEMLFGE